MNRFIRRVATVTVGLVLGWYVAGVILAGQWPAIPGAELGANYAHASDAEAGHDPHDEHGHATEDNHHTGSGHNGHDDEHGTDAAHGGGHDDDAALAAAGQLVPGPGDIPWFRPVLYVAGGLFVAAVVLGIPALKLRGPEPPDPADTHSH